MKKKTLRIVAILACFSFLTLLVPDTIAADRKVNRFNFIEKPMQLLSFIFPIFSSIFDIGNDDTFPGFDGTTGKKIKITDGKGKPKPPDGSD